MSTDISSGKMIGNTIRLFLGLIKAALFAEAILKQKRIGVKNIRLWRYPEKLWDGIT
jgi:hypothetical protein